MMGRFMVFIPIIVLILIILILVVSSIKIVPQAHAYVIERLGAYQGTWSVGFHVKVPIIDKVSKKVIFKGQCRSCRGGSVANESD